MTNILKAAQLTKTFGNVKALITVIWKSEKEKSSDTSDRPEQTRRPPLSC